MISQLLLKNKNNVSGPDSCNEQLTKGFLENPEMEEQ